MKKLIIILILGISSIGFSQSPVVYSSTLNTTNALNYALQEKQRKEAQESGTPYYPSASIISPTVNIYTVQSPASWITSIAMNSSDKRIEVQYQLDNLGHISMAAGCRIMMCGMWINAYSQNSDQGYFVEYMGDRYYF